MSAEPLLLHSPEVTWHVLRCVARCCFKAATWFQHKTGYSHKGVEWLNLEQALQEAPLSLVRQLEGDHIRRAFKKFDISMDDGIDDFIKTVLKRARQMYYNQAVLVLGAAGAGKSSVVNLLRGSNDATTGVLEDGVTIGAQVYHLQSEGNKLLLVDTEGWTPEWRASCCSRLCPRICASKFDEIEDAYRSALTTNGFHADQTPSIVIFVMNGTGGMRLQKFESAKMQQTFQRFDSGRVQTSVIPLVTHADCLPRRHEFNSVRESGGATAKRAFQKGRSCRFRDQSTTKVLPTFMVNAHPDASRRALGYSAQVRIGTFSTDVGPEESTPMRDGIDMSSDDFSRESSARDSIDGVHDVLREINQEVDVQRALPAFQREVRVAIAKDLAHQCKIYCQRQQFGCNPWKLFKAAHQAVADGESKTLPDELTAHMGGSPPWQVLEQIPKLHGRGIGAAVSAFCGPLKFLALVLFVVLFVGLELFSPWLIGPWQQPSLAKWGYDYVKNDFMKQTQVIVDHNISLILQQQQNLGNEYATLKSQVDQNKQQQQNLTNECATLKSQVDQNKQQQQNLTNEYATLKSQVDQNKYQQQNLTDEYAALKSQLDQNKHQQQNLTDEYAALKRQAEQSEELRLSNFEWVYYTKSFYSGQSFRPRSSHFCDCDTKMEGECAIPRAVPRDAASILLAIDVRSGAGNPEGDYYLDMWTYDGSNGTNKQRIPGPLASSRMEVAVGFSMIGQFGGKLYFKTGGQKPAKDYACKISLVH